MERSSFSTITCTFSTGSCELLSEIWGVSMGTGVSVSSGKEDSVWETGAGVSAGAPVMLWDWKKFQPK